MTCITKKIISLLNHIELLLLFFHLQPFENILIRQLRLKIVKLLIEINIFGYQSIFHRNLKKYTQFAASLLLVPIY